MWLILRSFLSKLLQDGSNQLPSFGKTVSIPFLVSAWLLASAYGVILLAHFDKKDTEISDLIWTLAGVAMILYATYKTGHVILQRKNGRMVIEKDVETPTEEGQ